MLKKDQKNRKIESFNSMVGCAGPFYLQNMNSKAMSTEKYSLTTFTVVARIFGSIGASRLLILTLDFMPLARI